MGSARRASEMAMAALADGDGAGDLQRHGEGAGFPSTARRGAPPSRAGRVPGSVARRRDVGPRRDGRACPSGGGGPRPARTVCEERRGLRARDRVTRVEVAREAASSR